MKKRLNHNPSGDQFSGQLRKYTRFSGLAIQMGVIIIAGTLGGVKLDQYLDISPLFTLIGSLGSIFLSLYLVIKELSIIKNKKDAEDSH